MQAEGTQHPLERLLAEELRCTECLLVCLEAERSALVRRDLEALENTTGEKLQHTRTLEQLEQQREKLLTELGFGSDNDGLQRCCKSLPGGAQLIRLWRQILDNVAACQTGNLTNGGILESGRQHVEQALCLLRGQSGTPSVYNPDGDASASLGQRELGKV